MVRIKEGSSGNCVGKIVWFPVSQGLLHTGREQERRGLLINFGAPTLREGLRRIVNGFQPSAFPRLRVNQGVSANLNGKGSKTN